MYQTKSYIDHLCPKDAASPPKNEKLLIHTNSHVKEKLLRDLFSIQESHTNLLQIIYLYMSIWIFFVFFSFIDKKIQKKYLNIYYQMTSQLHKMNLPEPSRRDSFVTSFVIVRERSLSLFNVYFAFMKHFIKFSVVLRLFLDILTNNTSFLK